MDKKEARKLLRERMERMAAHKECEGRIETVRASLQCRHSPPPSRPWLPEPPGP